MRGSDEKCVTGEEKEEERAEKGPEGGMQREMQGESVGKEGVAGRVTEKDCATDGDMQSQARRRQEWGCGRGREEGPEEGPERRCG